MQKARSVERAFCFKYIKAMNQYINSIAVIIVVAAAAYTARE
jgi:hypothetical protein